MRIGTFVLAAAAPTATLLLCFAASGCQSKAPTTETPDQVRPPLSRSSGNSVSPASGYDGFDLRSHPDAIVMKPIDPATLTMSQRQFGIAPRLDPKVQYQPDIILMEHGDQAIRSLASNGLIWTFDANAPHVNEFAMDKIVFATGRAVGRIAMLKREGDSVQVILLPVQFHDLIAKGSFFIDSPIDVKKMIPYVFPDFPQPKNEGEDQASALPVPGVDRWKGSIVVSRIDKRGKWKPVTLTTVSAEGKRKRFERVGRRWRAMPASIMGPLPFSREESGEAPRLFRANYQVPIPSFPGGLKPPSNLPKSPVPFPPGNFPQPPAPPDATVPPIPLPRGASNFCQTPTTPGRPIRMPGAIGPQITLPVLPECNPPTVPNLPRLEVDGLVPEAVAENGAVGVTFKYEKQGMHIKAAAMLSFAGTGVQAFLTAGSGVIPKDCGIQLTGVVAVVLYINSTTDQSWHVNILKRMELPVELSIPIASPVPFSVSFSQALMINTGFSARANSVLNAQGVYGVNGSLKAGYFNNNWDFDPKLSVSSKINIGKTAEGISLGIGSLLLGASMRVMLGLGGGPLSFGVFAKLIYTGAILKSPDEALPCRQGSMVVRLASGIGYSLPKILTDAVNAMLSLFTNKRIEAKGTVLDGPQKELFTETTHYPEGCEKQGGG